LQPLQHKFSP